MALIISQKIRQKLEDENHQAPEQDIAQCFANKVRTFVIDDREEHRTEPPTKWFVSETDYGRKLKVMFVMRGADIFIKSAYGATDEVERIYISKSKPTEK